MELNIWQICDRLTNERNNVQEVIRQEFADRLVATEEENKRLKNEMSEMRARHKLELTRIKESKEEEMEEVHKRLVAWGSYYWECVKLVCRRQGVVKAVRLTRG